MKKERTWRYITIGLSFASIFLIVYGFLAPTSSGINITEYGKISITPNDEQSVDIHLLEPATTSVPGDWEILQEEWTNALYVSEQHRGYAQTIDYGGTRHTNGFFLLVARVGIPTEPIVLSISKQSSYQGQRSIWIQPSDLDDENMLYYMDNFFGDEPYVNDEVYLTAVSLDDQEDDNFWVIGYSDENPYSGGSVLEITQNWGFGASHSDWDLSFGIHNEESAPDEPAINININGVSGALGILSLFGACFSGIKYGLVIGWL